MNYNSILHYAMEKKGFISIGIVDESEDNTCEIIDEESELNIYEKIQIILFENQFITPNNTSPCKHTYSNIIDNKRTKPIAIPRKK